MGCNLVVRRLDGLQGLCETSGWVATSLCDFWMGCRVFVRHLDGLQGFLRHLGGLQGFLRRLDGLQTHCVTSGWAAGSL